MPYSSPREQAVFQRLTLVLLAAFIFLFPTMLRNSGLGVYLCFWIAPFAGLDSPVYSAGRGPPVFVVTTIATVLGSMLLIAVLLYARRPKVARMLCYVAGIVSAPIGLVAVRIGLEVPKGAARRKGGAPDGGTSH